MKIVVAEKVSSAALKLLREEPGWNVVTPEHIKGTLAEEIGDADALIVRSAVLADASLLKRARKLRVIGRAGIGVDNIDLEAATRQGIAVMNTPGANAVAVAEHTLGLMLAMARHLCRADALLHGGRWEKKSLPGTELRGKTLGIVGLGRIGVEVARRARAFGMRLLAYDPFVSPDTARKVEAELCPLDRLLAASDYITLHLALTPQSAGLIGTEALGRVKKGARLVNCARGELVDDRALAAALHSGQLAGAALDVFPQEPLPTDSPLLDAPNLVLTPHIGGSTHEAQEAVGVQIALQVREYLRRGVIQNAVNVPSVSDAEYAELQPFLALAERLGAFVAQAGEGAPEEVTLHYSGAIAGRKTQLLRNAALAGLLNSMVAEEANLVNAAQMAEARGMRVRESAKTKVSSGAAASVITLEVRASGGQHTVRGTVLRATPRLLAVDGIDVEAPLERNLVYLRNRDVPGVIGRIGTVLGAARINIANFSLGRAEQAAHASAGPHIAGTGAEAVCVVHVDSAVPDAVLEELRAIPAITIAKAIRLA
jgi:D-3-phosphoglycerate dehydrogenase